jgi:hypothetical protein
MIAARSVVQTIRPAAHAVDSRLFKAAGLALVAIVSALFWMGFIAAAGHALGYAVPAGALVAVGGAIALFLSAVCAPIMLHS